MKSRNTFGEFYFKEDHYKTMLTEIMEVLKLVSDSNSNEKVDQPQFWKFGHWLMSVINLFNGYRTPSSELLKNKHVRQKCRVTKQWQWIIQQSSHKGMPFYVANALPTVLDTTPIMTKLSHQTCWLHLRLL
jgi:hypothetical protein